MLSLYVVAFQNYQNQNKFGRSPSKFFLKKNLLIPPVFQDGHQSRLIFPVETLCIVFTQQMFLFYRTILLEIFSSTENKLYRKKNDIFDLLFLEVI